MDVSFKDDVTVILHLSVPLMPGDSQVILISKRRNYEGMSHKIINMKNGK